MVVKHLTSFTNTLWCTCEIKLCEESLRRHTAMPSSTPSLCLRVHVFSLLKKGRIKLVTYASPAKLHMSVLMMCNIFLQSFLEIQKVLITPYVPNVVDASQPMAVLDKSSPSKSARDITIYFRGKCTPQTERYVGKKMRHAMVRPFPGSPWKPDILLICLFLHSASCLPQLG